jgi:hypothetical protein
VPAALTLASSRGPCFLRILVVGENCGPWAASLFLSAGLDTSRNHDGGQTIRVRVTCSCSPEVSSGKSQIPNFDAFLAQLVLRSRLTNPFIQPRNHRSPLLELAVSMQSENEPSNCIAQETIRVEQVPATCLFSRGGPLPQSSTFSCAQNASSDMFAFIVIVYVNRDLGIQTSTNTNDEHEIPQARKAEQANEKERNRS